MEAVLFAALILLSTSYPAAPARAASFSAPPQQVAPHGFGDAGNSYAWSSAWFRGHLYVGTARDALCVEGATQAFYAPGAGLYREQPAPGVTCAVDPRR